VGSLPSRRSAPPCRRRCSPHPCHFSLRCARWTLRGIACSRRSSASAASDCRWSFFPDASSRKPLKTSRCDSNYPSACSMTSLPVPFPAFLFRFLASRVRACGCSFLYSVTPARRSQSRNWVIPPTSTVQDLARDRDRPLLLELRP
jgi:hypothetical protein